jgi:hypothetical protein
VAAMHEIKVECKKSTIFSILMPYDETEFIHGVLFVFLCSPISLVAMHEEQYTENNFTDTEGSSICIKYNINKSRVIQCYISRRDA